MKKSFLIIVALLVSLASFARDLDVIRLAGDICHVRVSADCGSKYILLPVEESAKEAEVEVIVNNNRVRTLWIRLALSHIDYYVPFALDEFQGSEVLLQLHVPSVPITLSNRGWVGSDLCVNNIRLSNKLDFSTEKSERPAFHHTPEYGWMNDPNGMFYKDGEWHLYYQWGPYGLVWNNMTWGHSVSKDLIHWEHRAPAIQADALGAVFSGSCVVDHENTAGFGKDAVIAMYTMDGAVQSQNIAYSLDGGNTFTKYERNPVLVAGIPDFRDPNMFWNEEIGKWSLVLACGQQMHFYSSPDLKEWKEESKFGKMYGAHGGVWECPDLFCLPTPDGKSKKWVLLCNINPGGPMGGSATQYFIGNFDGHQFVPDDPDRYTGGRALWMDYGKDHYATVSFSDAPAGRRTVIAWMSNWEYADKVPAIDYRSSNSIARDLFLYTGSDGELYMGSRPAPEYDNAGLDKRFSVKGSCTWTLSNSEKESVVIKYDQKAMTLSVDRTQSGVVNFKHTFPAVTVAPLHKKLTSLRIFVDNNSVEVFGNDGEVVLTNIIFPSAPLSTIKVNQ